MRTITLILCTVMMTLLITSCDKSTGPNDDNPYGQEHIPWPSLADSPWPMQHGNPQSTGRSEYAAALNGEIVWEYETTGWMNNSPTIGSDGTIYFVTSADRGGGTKNKVFLNALSENGSLLWKYQLLDDTTQGIVAPGQVSPIISEDGTIYTGTWEGNLLAINPDGSLNWKFQADEAIYTDSFIIGLDGTIYMLAKDGYLYSIDSGGTLNWKITTDGGFYWNLYGTFSPDGKTLYVPGNTSAGSKTLYAFDLNGDVQWSFDTGGSVRHSPMVTSEGYIIIGPEAPSYQDSRGAYVFLLDSDGELMWKYNYYINDYPLTADPTIDIEGNIYFSGNENYLTSLTLSGEKRWQIQLDETIVASLICDSDGTIFCGTGTFPENYIYAISNYGEILWQIQTGEDRIYYSPIIGDEGVLYVSTVGRQIGVYAKIIAIR